MKITLLEVENFKRVRKISIAPGERSMVLIGGKNRQGKSSLLGAMSAALGGGREAPDQPVRKGKKRADIRIELDDGELVVHRRFLSTGSSTLEVRSKNQRLTSPQKILDRVVGTRFLDPLRFARLSEKEQRDVLLRCVDLGIDLDEHATRRRVVYQDRADANRDVKRLTAEVESTPDPGDVPEPADLDALLTELDELRERDSARVEAQRDLQDMRTAAAARQAEIDQMEAELKELQDAIKERRAAFARFVDEGKAKAAEAEKLANVDLAEDIAKAHAAVRDATTANENRARLVAQKEKRAAAAASLEDARQRAQKLHEDLEELDEKKSAALSAAKMPIEELDVDEEQVFYRGVPLSQASGAEQLQVSLAIAAALSPELRDIWVEDGALLDEDSLATMNEFAASKDLRIWLERVGTGDDDALVIEEGALRDAP